jgi:hypothetical protein
MRNIGKKINGLLLGALLFGLAGCAVTDVDRTADFSRLKSFGWGKAQVKTENPVYESTLIHKNIRKTIAEEFAKKGIVYDQSNPDFLVSYQTYTEKKEQATGRHSHGYPFYYPFRFSPFAYGWGWGFPYGSGYGSASSYIYTAGTLIIDIADAKTNEVVWRGTVSGNVDNVAKLQKQISKGVHAILKKYPVQPEFTPVLPDENGNV